MSYLLVIGLLFGVAISVIIYFYCKDRFVYELDEEKRYFKREKKRLEDVISSQRDVIDHYLKKENDELIRNEEQRKQKMKTFEIEK